MVPTFTTRSFEEDTADQWRTLLNSQMEWPVSFAGGAPGGFRARVSRFDFGGLSLLSHGSSPAVLDRAVVPGPRMFSFNFITRGKLSLTHCGRCNVLREGDMVLADGHQASRLAFEADTHVITVRIPAALLGDHLPQPERLCNLVLTPRHEFTEVLRATLTSLLQMGRKGFARSLQDMSVQPFLGLLSFALLANFTAPVSEDKPTAHLRLREIRRYIDENLTEANLSPARIAGRFGLSPRYLRKLFAQDGDSVTKYIQRRRLEKSAGRMTNLLWKEQSITEICFDCGFNSAPHFTRAFKARFGMTPKEYRRRAGAIPGTSG